MPGKDVSSLSVDELQSELNAFRITDYKWTLLGCTLAVPLGIRAPAAQRYLPLLVFGSVGGLADWFSAQTRLAPYQQRLAQLQAERKHGDGLSADSASASGGKLQ
jgi:hypothetical protein